jgi:hypothetical protein
MHHILRGIEKLDRSGEREIRPAFAAGIGKKGGYHEMSASDEMEHIILQGFRQVLCAEPV